MVVRDDDDQAIGVRSRVEALAAHLRINPERIRGGWPDPCVWRVAPHRTPEEAADQWGGNTGAEYLVLTREEAEWQALAAVENDLWSLEPDFILRHISYRHYGEARELLTRLREQQGSAANRWIRALVRNVTECLRDAVATFGRGHFLGRYDGREHQVGGYYVYLVGPGTEELQYGR